MGAGRRGKRELARLGALGGVSAGGLRIGDLGGEGVVIEELVGTGRISALSMDGVGFGGIGVMKMWVS